MVVSWVGQSADAKGLGGDPLVPKTGTTLDNLIVDDLMLFTGLVSAAQTYTTPAGWAAHPNSNSASRPLLYKFADAADVAAASFGFVVSGSANALGTISAYRGVSKTNPWAGTAGFVSTASTTVTIGAATPAAGGPHYLAHIVSKLTVANWTPPGTVGTEDWDQGNVDSLGSTAGGDEFVTGGVSTGTRVWLASVGAGAGMGYIVPLREANIAHTVSADLVGDGVATREVLSIAKPVSLVGEGVETRQIDAATSLNLVGDGVVTRALAAFLSRDVVGDGVNDMTKTANVLRVFDLVGDGVPSREPLSLTMSRSLTGDGIVDAVKSLVASKMFDLVGDGTITSAKQVVAARSADLTGEGTVTETEQKAYIRSFSIVGDGVVEASRAVVASKSFNIVGDGDLTKGSTLIAMAFDAVGDGEVSMSRSVGLAKVFNITGEGVVTEIHPVQAERSFDLEGVGEILITGPNGSTITMPIDQEFGGGTTVVLHPLFIFDD